MGSLLKKILPDPQVGHLGIHVPQAHLLKVLIEEAKQCPNFTLMTNTRVIDLLMNEDGSIFGVKALHEGKEITIESRLTVGADGRYSTVRKKAGIEVTNRKHGYDLLWARIPAPAGWEPSIKMALIDGFQLSLFTQAKGFVQIGWNIEEGSFPELRKQSFTTFIEKLIKAFPVLEQSVNENIKSWNDFVLLDVHSNFSENWGGNGVAFLGDAVHTMTPTGAFGLNSAMKDADCLAQLITPEEINKIRFNAM